MKRAELLVNRMCKVLHKLCKSVANELDKSLPTLGESFSEVSHSIPEPRNFSEVTRLTADVKNDWLKTTLTEIIHLIDI